MDMPDPLFDGDLRPPRLLNIHCTGCQKTPDQLPEYSREMIDYPESWTPADYVRREEGTFNQRNGHFLCTACYVRAGMPSSPRGWVAP